MAENEAVGSADEARHGHHDEGSGGSGGGGGGGGACVGGVIGFHFLVR